MVQTVTGLIGQEEMGCTLSHEHLCIDLARVRKNDDSTFGYSDEVKLEIMRAKELGVRTIVEVSCNDMGRNIEELYRLSKECGVFIIASTGFYLDEYHSETIKKATIEEITNIFIHDLTIGIDGTNKKAGVIGEVATSECITESEKKVLQAAAYAAKEIGCAIITHCQLGKLGDEQASIFQEIGINPRKVVLGHIDLSNNIEYMCRLLDKGFNIAFDTIGKENYLTDDIRAKNLKILLDKGYTEQIVLSQDVSKKSYFSQKGKFGGYTTVLKSFVPKLLELGIDKKKIDKMLVTNPYQIFKIDRV